MRALLFDARIAKKNYKLYTKGGIEMTHSERIDCCSETIERIMSDENEMMREYETSLNYERVELLGKCYSAADVLKSMNKVQYDDGLKRFSNKRVSYLDIVLVWLESQVDCANKAECDCEMSMGAVNML